MNTQALMTRMTPSTLVSMIKDLNSIPRENDAISLYFMGCALSQLFVNVGAESATALLTEKGVDASNPFVEAMLEDGYNSCFKAVAGAA